MRILPISHEVKVTNENFENEIWSVNRIKQERYFSSKIMKKVRQGD